MKRGEIWWADLEPARGREIRKVRPVVIVSPDGIMKARKTIVAVPLSTGPTATPPIVVAVPSADDRSMAACDQIRAMDRSRFLKLAGVMGQADMATLSAALVETLGL